MLRVREVAERLRMSSACIYTLVETGKLQAFRFGPHNGAIRVSEEQFQAYLEAYRSLPHSAIPVTETE